MKKFTKLFEQKVISDDEIKSILVDVLDNGCKIRIQNVFVDSLHNNEIKASLKLIHQTDNLGKIITIDTKDIDKSNIKFGSDTFHGQSTRWDGIFFTDIDRIRNVVESVIDYIDYFEGYKKSIHFGSDKIVILLVGNPYNSEEIQLALKTHQEFILTKLIKILTSPTFIEFKKHYRKNPPIEISGNDITISDDDNAAWGVIYCLNEYMGRGTIIDNHLKIMNDIRDQFQVISDYMKKFNLKIYTNNRDMEKRISKIYVDIYTKDT